MSATRLRVDLAIGRPVRDASGRRVGTLREMRIEIAAPGSMDYVVRDFEISTGGFVERLLGAQLSNIIAQRFGWRGRRFVVPWDHLDLTNPRAPRLRTPLNEKRGDA